MTNQHKSTYIYMYCKSTYIYIYIYCTLSTECKKNPTITDSMIWQHACKLFFHVCQNQTGFINCTRMHAHTHTHTHIHCLTHTYEWTIWLMGVITGESQTFCCGHILVQSSTAHFQSINSMAKLPYDKLLVGGCLI